jgi:hypothetical protein
MFNTSLGGYVSPGERDIGEVRVLLRARKERSRGGSNSPILLALRPSSRPRNRQNSNY